jgi:hypothetical protein
LQAEAGHLTDDNSHFAAAKLVAPLLDRRGAELGGAHWDD